MELIFKNGYVETCEGEMRWWAFEAVIKHYKNLYVHNFYVEAAQQISQNKRMWHFIARNCIPVSAELRNSPLMGHWQASFSVSRVTLGWMAEPSSLQGFLTHCVRGIRKPSSNGLSIIWLSLLYSQEKKESCPKHPQQDALQIRNYH